MTTKRFWQVVVFGGFVVALTAAGITRARRQRIESDLTALAARSAEVHIAVAKNRDSLAGLEQRAADIEREMRQPAAPAVVPESLPGDEGAILVRDAALRAKFEQFVRRDVEGKYGALFRQWKLSPEKRAALYALLVRDAETTLDLRGVAGAHGLDLSHPGATKLRTRQFEELLAAEKALLAPAEYQALQQSQRMAGIREGLEELASSMAPREPLRAVQFGQLQQLLAEASSAYQGGGRATWETVDWSQVLARAPAFLSEAQLAEVRGYAQFWRLIAGQMTRMFPELTPGR